MSRIDRLKDRVKKGVKFWYYGSEADSMPSVSHEGQKAMRRPLWILNP